jgi:hypothetical protein
MSSHVKALSTVMLAWNKYRLCVSRPGCCPVVNGNVIMIMTMSVACCFKPRAHEGTPDVLLAARVAGL